jgi:hypothetical protein
MLKPRTRSLQLSIGSEGIVDSVLPVTPVFHVQPPSSLSRLKRTGRAFRLTPTTLSL